MATIILALFLWIQISILSSSSSPIVYPSQDPSSHPQADTDLEALLAFKSAITYDYLNSLTTWTSNISFCRWNGITCSPEQRVVSLNLTCMALEGIISPLLGNLSFLTVLDLSHNFFNHHIPYQLGRLSRLRILLLSSNRLQGLIPTTLGACTNLQTISMFDNHLNGHIPTQLGFLPNLGFLDFGRNNLTSKIPNSLGNISSLNYLNLGENRLDGPIPSELGMLSQLNYLDLKENHHKGEIPLSLSNCTALQYLSIDLNYITGEIPGELCSKNTRLLELYLGANQLSGTIPVTLSNCSRLQRLELSFNHLTGIVPSEFGKLSGLTLLNMEFNNLVSGSPTSLPLLTALTNCSLLKVIGLSHNHLTGVIPSSVAQLSPKLEKIRLDGNRIRGEIPRQIGNLTSLTVLSLPSNLLAGVIPSTVGMLRRLERLDLSGNNFNGNIPEEIGKLRSLYILDLSENKLSKNIPDSLSHLQQIGHLVLHHNFLTGNIPSSLGKWLTLEKLDLSYNRLRGHIPPPVAGLSNLAFYFNLSNNLLQGTIPLELSKMDKVQAIDISANQLTGNIPDVLGSCISLEYLNFSFNQLRGPIPYSLGELQNLRVLDFSSNNLSGKIPLTLEKLKVVRHLIFSMNQLSGEIPKDGVFKLLGPTSFTGNPGLCGPWVKLPACSAPKHKTLSHLKRVVIPIGAATTLVIWCIFIGFLWRCFKRGHLMAIVSLKLENRRISLSELMIATEAFSEANLLGMGSFGKVYKGILKDGTMAAIKVLNLQNEDGRKSFDRECRILATIRHRNLVRVITCYSDLNFKALIFPLMPNGSLDKLLYPRGPQSSQGYAACRLDLFQRLSIAIDIAQGIEYLHHHCFVQVIHCDLKPSNVLLGEDMTAYLTDFGISRLFFVNSMNSSTSTLTLKGSIGYIAPEYGLSGHVTTKGDVYSYGIVLLEIVTGKSPTNNMFIQGMNLQKWVRRDFPNTIEVVVDSSLLIAGSSSEENKAFKCLRELINIGLLCTKESPAERPSMMDIVRILHSVKGTFLGVSPTSTPQSDLSSLLTPTNFVSRSDDSQASLSY
ncbi:hypothetical protein KI387_029452 [Taxus chinensis]|uniref:non-specific serine/threonine protein kinase n=1 Tax=Taxus chinensis TaxID=29808 RepID=A0AA38CD15_TAXCH|nr:hypothetical protein KI387_029452 [Taxus chinensis]